MGTNTNDREPARDSERTRGYLRRLAAVAHDRWCDEMRDDGWRYGPTYDEAARTHDALVPFEQLPEAVQNDVILPVRYEEVLQTLAGLTFHGRGAGATLESSQCRVGRWVRLNGLHGSPTGVIVSFTTGPDYGAVWWVNVRWDHTGEVVEYGLCDLMLADDTPAETRV